MKILLGVCGSISAYRSLDICRGFAKTGHEVKVVLTKGALEFVKPEVFKYLGASEVFGSSDDFNAAVLKERNVLHIELSKWAERIVIAPASANTLAKMAWGMCDDLLSSVFLASPGKTTVIYPAMNTNMLEHPLTKDNFNRLKRLPNTFLMPSKEGELACGDIGSGKLQDVELIVETAPLINPPPYKKKMLITTGATVAPLDPVRYLTNPASGLTGYEIAKSFLEKGYEAVLLAGHGGSEKIDYLAALPNCSVYHAQTTRRMRELVQREFPSCDIYISSAALSDIEFDQSETKLKKESLQDKLSIKRAPDVLKEILGQKSGQKVVGFAAETEDSLAVFEKKWKNKPVDVLVGNKVSSAASGQALGFGQDGNDYTILKRGKLFFQGALSKTDLGAKIAEALEE